MGNGEWEDCSGEPGTEKTPSRLSVYLSAYLSVGPAPAGPHHVLCYRDSASGA